MGAGVLGELKTECIELRGGAKLVEGGQHLSAQSQEGTTFECTKLRGGGKI